MSLKNLLVLFGTTLLIGMAAGILAGLGLQLTDQDFHFFGSAVGFNLFEMALAGMMFAMFSLMGLFAYLTLNYIAVGILGQKFWWNLLQLFLTIVILVNAGFYRYIYFAGTAQAADFIFPAIVLALTILVAYWKVKMTNKTAWIPTLFFMSAITILESMPALRMDNAASLLFMSVPLFACNAWQILRLHKLVRSRA
ncbi:MAG TPA: KinB-signaling pathway activation protein [Bacilli bacterium]